MATCDNLIDLADVDTSNTLLITYKNPSNKDAVPADCGFTGRKEIIQGLKLGVRLGLKMTLFSTSDETLKFADAFLNYYLS